MTEDKKKETEAPKSSRRGSVLSLLFLSFLSGAGLHYALVVSGKIRPSAQIQTIQQPAVSSDRLLQIEERLSEVEKKISQIEPRAVEASQEVQAAAQKVEEANTQELARLREDIASRLAFIQMQQTALTGQPFEQEWKTFRLFAEKDPALMALLAKLEKSALGGALNAEALRVLWRSLSGEGQAALRKTAAQTWQDRFIVALEGLVSIRSLKPEAGETLSFAAVDLDLSRGNLTGALEKVHAFPPEVKAVLQDWEASVQKRLEVEATLNQIAARLIEVGQKTEESIVEKTDEKAFP